MQVIPEWTEIDFGLFEGKNHRELSGNMAYQEWIDSNGTLPFPEGESREEFIDRSIAGLKSLKSMDRQTRARCRMLMSVRELRRLKRL